MQVTGVTPCACHLGLWGVAMCMCVGVSAEQDLTCLGEDIQDSYTGMCHSQVCVWMECGQPEKNGDPFQFTQLCLGRDEALVIGPILQR